MSIFSPPSSSTTLATRPPFGPTHAPIGSITGSSAQTAIFVRLPASRAMDLISTVPSKDLRHLELEQALDQARMRPADEHLRAARTVLRTSTT